MTPPDGRDRGLATVRKATIWLAGGALLAVGGTAAILGRPTSAGAGSTQSTTSGESVGGAAPGATTTQPRSGATATTTPRSSTTTVPSTPAPRTSRRRPSVSSGGS